MSEIRREALFGKLNPVAYQTIEGATVFAKMRGNPFVELVHWVHQLLQHQDSDWQRIVSAFDIDLARLATDLTQALDKLPRGSTSVQDLSPQVDRLVERTWSFTTLLFNEQSVRTGHLLFTLLKEKELTPQLRAISKHFDKIGPDDLVRRWSSVVKGSVENDLAKAMPAAGAAGGSGDAAPAPAALGKQEALNRYAVDLTERARKGEIDPITGRDPEMRQIVDILMRRRQNNPILTGEAGVGKTAVVEGLALRIASGDVPPPLQGVSLRTLDIGLLQAGASMKGEFEQRLRQVIEEVQASPTPIILFIDEAHTLIGAGGAAGTGDAANLLKPALARGTLRTIAATTWAEYKKHIEKDPALTRRFQVVQVDEPSEEVALRMMRGMAYTLEKHHRVQVLDDALDAAVKLSHRYIPARQLPDKSVSLLDTACARVAISQHATPAAVEDSKRHIEALETELGIISREAAVGVDVAKRKQKAEERLQEERTRLDDLSRRWKSEKALVDRILELRRELRKGGEAIAGKARKADTAPAAKPDAKPALAAADGDAGSANELPPTPEQREKLLTELNGLSAELNQLQGDTPLILPTVDGQAVSAVVSDWTGIPVGRMVSNEIQAVLSLSEKLAQRVIGQKHGLDLITQRIQTTRAGLEDPRKPIGVFLLAGPSGVGKTETALALAEALFGGEQSLITINMSEFQEAHTVSTLKGAPPGYVGYGEGGVLTEAVRRRPYSVVLLDEVEKAHPDVHELFFQVFDKGFMEDGEGRTIDFKNTLILLTSNAGTDVLMHACKDPNKIPDVETLNKALRKPLLDVFPPALLGRMVTIPYYPLSDDMIRRIVRLQLERIVKRVQARHGIPLVYDESVPALIASRCTELESGARMIEALLSNTVLPRLSHEFLTRLVQGTPLTQIEITTKDGDFAYNMS
ncbi:MAG TPA: type VI secretion system ATPase TssH [Polyangiales bacterium]